MDLINALRNGKKKIAIIGLGYLGYSCLIKFIRRGIQCVVTDPKPERLEDFAKCTYPDANRFVFWKNMAEAKYICGENLYETVPLEEVVSDDVAAYIISVPVSYQQSHVENNLSRTLQQFKDLSSIYKDDAPIIIIETLLKPYSIEKIITPELRSLGLEINTDFILAYSPRKDWNLEDLIYKTKTKLVGCDAEEHKELLEAFYSLIYPQVHFVADTKAVEVAACLENALNFVSNALYSQLVFAFPDIDISKTLPVVENFPKDEIPGIHASTEELLSTQYLVDTAKSPDFLSILGNAISGNLSIQMAIVEFIKRRNVKKIGILGLLAHENRSETISPSLLLPQLLIKEGLSVNVHDPFVSEAYLTKHFKCDSLSFPQALEWFDCLVLLTPHNCYSMLSSEELLPRLKNCRLILDNVGTWRKHNLSETEEIEYKVIGESLALI